MKRVVALAILTTVVLFWTAGAHASSTFSDDFSSAVANPAWWSVSTYGNSVIAQTAGQVLMTQGSTYGSSGNYGFFPLVSGNFSVEVDFLINPATWKAYSNNVRIGISSSAYGATERIDDWGTGYYLTHFGYVAYGSSTSDMVGKLKFERVGDNIAGYFWDNTTSGWSLINSQESYYSGVTSLGFAIWGLGSYSTGGEQVAFDNFKVTADKFLDPNTGAEIVVTPEPASMLLFGVGGAAMAWRRLRRKI